MWFNAFYIVRVSLRPAANDDCILYIQRTATVPIVCFGSFCFREQMLGGRPVLLLLL